LGVIAWLLTDVNDDNVFKLYHIMLFMQHFHCLAALSIYKANRRTVSEKREVQDVTVYSTGKRTNSSTLAIVL
jgi:hypothetical protein